VWTFPFQGHIFWYLPSIYGTSHLETKLKIAPTDHQSTKQNEQAFFWVTDPESKLMEKHNVFSFSNNRTTWFIYVTLMALVAGLTFGNLLTQNFWDGADDESIMRDIVMLSQDLSLIISPMRGHDARPPFDLVILGGYTLWGENPVAFHAFHIALHLWASILVAITLYREKVNLELCFLTGLLFLVNVAHFRAVHWITSINYVLALIFILFVFICYRNVTKTHHTKWLIISVLMLALAILTHPAAMFMAFFCATFTWQEKGSLKQTLASSWPLLLSAPILVFIAHIISVHGQSDAALTTPDPMRIFTNVFWYLGRLVTTAHWISRATTTNFTPFWELGIGACFLVLLLVLYKKRVFPVAHASIWIGLCIVPFINNPPERLAVGPSRHLYFASLGATFILAWALQTLVKSQGLRWSQKKRQGVFATLVFLITLSSIYSLKKTEALSVYLTAISNKTLAPALFERAITQAPNLIPTDAYTRTIQMGLTSGNTYRHLLQPALQNNPDNAQLKMLWGITSLVLDNSEEQIRGERYIQEALKEMGDTPQIRYDIAVMIQNIAVYFNQKDDLDRATHLYTKALFYYPDYPLALYSLGDIYRFQKQNQKAMEAFQKVLLLVPNHKMAQAKIMALQNAQQ